MTGTGGVPWHLTGGLPARGAARRHEGAGSVGRAGRGVTAGALLRRGLRLRGLPAVPPPAGPLTWRGAAESLVLLVAVFGVWSGTSFEARLLSVGRSQTQGMLLAVLVGLFMNTAIAHAFETGTGGLAFVVPLLLISAGRSILMIGERPAGLGGRTDRGLGRQRTGHRAPASHVLVR